MVSSSNLKKFSIIIILFFTEIQIEIFGINFLNVFYLTWIQLLIIRLEILQRNIGSLRYCMQNITLHGVPRAKTKFSAPNWKSAVLCFTVCALVEAIPRASTHDKPGKKIWPLWESNQRALMARSLKSVEVGTVYQDMMDWKLNRSHCVIFLSEFLLICARSLCIFV
jgi:hypothetical protein